MLAASAFVLRADNWVTDWSFSPVAAWKAPNLIDNGSIGTGIDIGYSLNKSVSLHGEILKFQRNHEFDWPAIDETSLLVKADFMRDSKERFVVYALAGGDRSWGNIEDWAFGAGLGFEVKFSKNISIGADSRVRAWFKQDKDLLTRGLLNIKF